MTTTALMLYRQSELADIASGCLHRVKAIWIDGVDDSSDISLLGIAFHKANHLYIMALVEQNLPQDAELAHQALIEGVAISQLPPRLIPELRTLWEFHSERFALNLDRFIAAEERGTGGQVAFAPDLVVGHSDSNALEIQDFKSGWHPPLTEAELKTNFQARVYSRFARDRWPGWSSYHFTLNAVRFNKSVTVEFSPQELDSVDTEIQAAIATIELAKASNQWPAIPGPSCRFCNLACPVADNKIALPKRLSLEQRQPVAEWVLVAEKQLRQIKKVLKESVTTYGPIDLGGVVWDNRPTLSKSYPIDAILAAFTKLKINRDAAEVIAAGGDLTISHSALKKVMRLYPELEPMLAGSAKEKTGFRFSAAKPGVEDDDDE